MEEIGELADEVYSNELPDDVTEVLAEASWAGADAKNALKAMGGK
jgi:hypothetical protein